MAAAVELVVVVTACVIIVWWRIFGIESRAQDDDDTNNSRRQSLFNTTVEMIKSDFTGVILCCVFIYAGGWGLASFFQVNGWPSAPVPILLSAALHLAPNFRSSTDKADLSKINVAHLSKLRLIGYGLAVCLGFIVAMSPLRPQELIELALMALAPAAIAKVGLAHVRN
jgi:hypothetical protein